MLSLFWIRKMKYSQRRNYCLVYSFCKFMYSSRIHHILYSWCRREKVMALGIILTLNYFTIRFGNEPGIFHLQSLYYGYAIARLLLLLDYYWTLQVNPTSAMATIEKLLEQWSECFLLIGNMGNSSSLYRSLLLDLSLSQNAPLSPIFGFTSSLW